MSHLSTGRQTSPRKANKSVLCEERSNKFRSLSLCMMYDIKQPNSTFWPSYSKRVCETRFFRPPWTGVGIIFCHFFLNGQFFQTPTQQVLRQLPSPRFAFHQRLEQTHGSYKCDTAVLKSDKSVTCSLIFVRETALYALTSLSRRYEIGGGVILWSRGRRGVGRRAEWRRGWWSSSWWWSWWRASQERSNALLLNTVRCR